MAELSLVPRRATVARHRHIHRLGLCQGTALFVGAVLGPGVLALPRLAAAAAGPASLVTWAVLLALSVPVSLTFAALGARSPDGGGVATFAGSAFGRDLAAAVGWWFFLAIPIGVPAGALIGGEYVAVALGLGGSATVRGSGVSGRPPAGQAAPSRGELTSTPRSVSSRTRAAWPCSTAQCRRPRNSC